jgi:hypothetical protein
LPTYAIINRTLGYLVFAAVPNVSLIALIAMFFFMSFYGWQVARADAATH